MGFTETDVDDIEEALKAWTPSPAEREEHYEDALYSFLHDRFPSEIFQRQYALGKTKADIFVKFKDGARVVVEMKRNLCDRSEYHRLIGQTYEYLTESNSEVVVVLCGSNDPALVKLAREAIHLLGRVIDKKVKVVEKKAVVQPSATAGAPG